MGAGSRAGLAGPVAAPRPVEAGAGPVGALEAVGAEEVALGLEEVRGAAGLVHHVEVAERRGDRQAAKEMRVFSKRLKGVPPAPGEGN